MKYTEPKFSVAMQGDAYAQGWDRVFKQGLRCVACDAELPVKHKDEMCAACLLEALAHDGEDCDGEPEEFDESLALALLACPKR